MIHTEDDKEISLSLTLGPLLSGSIQSTKDEILQQQFRQTQRSAKGG